MLRLIAICSETRPHPTDACVRNTFVFRQGGRNSRYGPEAVHLRELQRPRPEGNVSNPSSPFASMNPRLSAFIFGCKPRRGPQDRLGSRRIGCDPGRFRLAGASSCLFLCALIHPSTTFLPSTRWTLINSVQVNNRSPLLPFHPDRKGAFFPFNWGAPSGSIGRKLGFEREMDPLSCDQIRRTSSDARAAMATYHVLRALLQEEGTPEPVAPAPEPEAEVGEPPPAVGCVQGGDELLDFFCTDNIRSGDELLTSMVTSLVIGTCCFLLFATVRTRLVTFKTRLLHPQVTHRPDPLPSGGWQHLWNWIPALVRVTDQQILRDVGLDALVMDKCIRMFAHLFLVYCILGIGIILPVNWSGNVVDNRGEQGATTTFDKMSLTNIPQNSSLLWVHFVVLYVLVFYTLFILYSKYREFIWLRHKYITDPGDVNHWRDQYLTEQKRQMGRWRQDIKREVNRVFSKILDKQGSPQQSSTSEEAVAHELDPFEIHTPKSPPEEESPPYGRMRESLTIEMADQSFQEKLSASLSAVPPPILGAVTKDLGPVDDSSARLTRGRHRRSHSKSLEEVFHEELMMQAGDRNIQSSPKLFVDRAVDLSPRFRNFEAIGGVATKWWDEVTRTDQTVKRQAGDEEPRTDLEGRYFPLPSVRHRQQVNTVDGEGREISVNAALYVVLLQNIAWRRSESELHSYLEIQTVFRELFPGEVTAIVPVKNHYKVDMLLLKWDRVLAELERVYERKRQGENEPTMKVKCGSRFWKKEVVVAETYLQDLCSSLEKQIVEARQDVMEGPSSPAYFVIFSSAKAAAIASQCDVRGSTVQQWRTMPAPAPDEVRWQSLWKDWKSKGSRGLTVFAFIFLVMIFPVGIFTGALSQLNNAFCNEAGDWFWPWYCDSTGTWPSFVRNLLTGWIPAILLGLWNNIIVPKTFYYLAAAECSCVSNSQLDRRIGSLFFYFDVFNVLIGGVIGGTALAQLDQIISDPGQILNLLGAGIPQSANFFISYCMTNALLFAPLRLTFPHIGVLIYLMSKLLLILRVKKIKSQTTRDYHASWAPKSNRYGREFGLLLLIFLVGVSYSVMNPIILPWCFLYFLFAFVVWRYGLLYIYLRVYESGGRMWPFVFTRIVLTLFVLHVFTSALFFVKLAFWQFALMWCTLPPILYKFHNHCNARYKQNVHSLPLEWAEHMPRVHISNTVYQPPALRYGSAGWTPEAGKAWANWAAPLYTL